MTKEPVERRFLFDFLIHEAENVHNRVDWFLIFHGILFEAFLAAHYYVHRISLGVLGSLVSYVWLVAGYRQLWNLRHLVKAMSDDAIMGSATGNLFRGLWEARKKQSPWIRWAQATPAFCIFLPLAVFTAWVVVTTTYSACGFSWAALLVIVVAITAATVIWRFTKAPQVSDQAVALLRPPSPPGQKEP